MKSKREPKTFFAAFLLGILVLLLIQTAAAEDTVQLIDVSVGDMQEDSACIFKVNGKTVVVDRRDKVTVDGITIYVQEVYPVNSESKSGDRCEFMYSGGEKSKETEIKEETIGEKIILFYFGDKEEAEIEEAEDTETEENAQKEVGDNTVVRVNGYDVTGLSVAVEDTKEQTITQSTEENTETKGFFSKILSWMFG